MKGYILPLTTNLSWATSTERTQRKENKAKQSPEWNISNSPLANKLTGLFSGFRSCQITIGVKQSGHSKHHKQILLLEQWCFAGVPWPFFKVLCCFSFSCSYCTSWLSLPNNESRLDSTCSCNCLRWVSFKQNDYYLIDGSLRAGWNVAAFICGFRKKCYQQIKADM